MFLFNNCKKIYILGIGGSSMQALAIILKMQGYKVYGSDSRYGDFYKILTSRGIEVDITPDIEKIKCVDLVLYSLAVPSDCSALQEAKRLGKRVLSRKEFLSLLDKNYEEVIAVSGTHGKSTTTYLIASILHNAGFEATYHIGASSKVFEGGGLYEGDKYLVSEACEYKDSFLSFTPSVAVVLNIEPDHPDYFTSTGQLLSSFLTFAGNIRDNGLLIVESKLQDVFRKYLYSINRYDIEIVSVGEGGDFYFDNVKVDNTTTFDLWYKGEFLGNFSTTLNGYYNIYNIIISIIVAKHYNIDNKIIASTIENLQGLSRRFERVGMCNGAEIIVDYAHHPSEISAVIGSSKRNKGRLIVVFQPHTYSRTTALFDEFAKCFKGADEIIITKTYKSRDKKKGKTAFDLFLEVAKSCDVRYFDDFLSIAKYIKSTVTINDRVLLLGAGDINELAKYL